MEDDKKNLQENETNKPALEETRKPVFMNKKVIILALAIVVVAVIVLLLSCGNGKKNTNNVNSESGQSTTAGDNLTPGGTGNSENQNSNTNQNSESSTPENPNLPTGDDATTPNTPGDAQNNPNIDTGNLSSDSVKYEGTKGTGKYNYGEALQKAILFYELQRSGDLPEKTRCNWRGDSGLLDGSDVGLDLTGGLYDAGDNVKFNLPMAYTAATLALALYENEAAFVEAGQAEYLKDSIKWIDDYLIKCHPEDHVYYYQVGDGNLDHSWWGPAEVMQMNRPSYKVTDSEPGATVVAEAAAALASGSVIFKDSDKAYADKCLEHAKSLFEFAESTKSDAGYTAANGFYNSWSGFNDELIWSATWLYIATGDDNYLKKAEGYWNPEGNYKWTHCWDDVNTGATLMLYKLTGNKKYSDWLDKNMSFWMGNGGEKIAKSPKGLGILDSWGTLRYATTEAFIAALYAGCDGVSADKAKAYMEFAESQINYALGDGGRSYVVGFGDNAPKNPHHRTAQGSYCDNMNEPNPARHTLYGALVGGPDAGDAYDDVVSDFCKNEVACDYNAGFVGILSIMYSKYHGETIVDFGAVENVNVDEVYAEGCINVNGDNFIEVKAMVYNTSAWPARVIDDLELRYYVDLSEVYEAGGSATDIVISTNYSQGAKSASLVCLDEKKHLYYVSIDFSGEKIYPGGQNSYKKEVQFRILNEGGVLDNTNDPSYKDIEGANGGSLKLMQNSGVYAEGRLQFGLEPAAGDNAGQTITHESTGGQNQNQNQNPDNTQQGGNQGQTQVQQSAKSEKISLSNSASYDTNGNTIALNLTLINESDGTLDLNKLAIYYYFTKDGGESVCECDYSCSVSGDAYSALGGVAGSVSDAKGGANVDSVVEITTSDNLVLNIGATWQMQLRIHKNDWTNYTTTNDYSGEKIENIVVKYDGKVIFGNEP